jgi:hypothetical protein
MLDVSVAALVTMRLRVTQLRRSFTINNSVD